MARRDPPDSPSLFDFPLEPPEPERPDRSAANEEAEPRRSQVEPAPSERLIESSPPPVVVPSEEPLSLEPEPEHAFPEPDFEPAQLELEPPPDLPTPVALTQPAPMPEAPVQPTAAGSPLFEAEAPAPQPAEPDWAVTEPGQLNLDPPPAAVAAPAAEELEGDVWAEAAQPRFGSLPERLLAGTADLLLHGAVALIVLALSTFLGVSPSRAAFGPLLLFLAIFSFLYSSVALAFWGATPGMAWQGLVARNATGGTESEEPLTFTQSIRRWLGSLASLLLVGLPLLPLLWGGRALADLVSRSVTLKPRS